MEWSSIPEINPQLGISLNPQTGVIEGIVASSYQIKHVEMNESEGIPLNQQIIRDVMIGSGIDLSGGKQRLELGTSIDISSLSQRVRRTKVVTQYVEVPIISQGRTTIMIK